MYVVPNVHAQRSAFSVPVVESYYAFWYGSEIDSTISWAAILAMASVAASPLGAAEFHEHDDRPAYANVNQSSAEG